MTKERSLEDRWIALFAIARVSATVLALAMLQVHTLTSDDRSLAVMGGLYGLASVLVATRFSNVAAHPAAWLFDAVIAFGLIVGSDEWRSPFYLFALTALVLPAVALSYRAAVAAGAVFTAAYLGVAVLVGLHFPELRQTARLESFATQLLIPPLGTVALAYAAALLRERERSERLAVEAERRRIGMELHDSAKQRIHAAHLVLSSVERRVPDEDRSWMTQAMSELRSAAAELETSVSDLNTPLEGLSLDEALRSRARELELPDGPALAVNGSVGDLPAFVEVHAYRVASEAIANALRHACAERIEVTVGMAGDELRVSVVDDGRGMPAYTRPGAQGLKTMAARVASLGGRLDVGAGPGGSGTGVELLVPLNGHGNPR